MSKKYTFVSSCILAASLVSISAFAEDLASNQISVSGNLTLVSEYVARGLTNFPENDQVSLQAYLNASYENFYVAYWGSSLNYSFRELQGGSSHGGDKYEHNFIVGYSFEHGETTYDFWDATYYYQGGRNTTSNEIGFTITKPIGEKGTINTGVSTYLNDAFYMNQWDTYATLNYIYQVNDNLSTTFGVAGSYFKDDGKYEGKGSLDTKEDWVFRFATVKLDYLVNDNVNVFGQYYFGGHDRSGVKQKNMPVFGLSYSF